MKEVKISKNRLKQLEFAEKKLNALEAGGVDSWDGYSESLAEIAFEIEIEESAWNALAAITETLCDGVYEPADKHAGYGFTDESLDSAFECLKEFITQTLEKERARK